MKESTDLKILLKRNFNDANFQIYEVTKMELCIKDLKDF